MGQEYITPIGRHARLILDLVAQARETDDWEGIDALLDKIEKQADQLTSW